MIDPNNVTQPYASRAWKEEFLIFAACVAGKGAFQQAQKVHDFLALFEKECASDGLVDLTPFEMILYCGKPSVDIYLRRVKMGQYERLGYAIAKLSELNVETCTVEQLESIKGIGPKTARFFIVHTRVGARHAILDTHILKHMNAQGIKAPKSTPSGKKYLDLEQEFLKMVDESGMSVADYDLMLWKSFRKDKE